MKCFFRILTLSLFVSLLLCSACSKVADTSSPPQDSSATTATATSAATEPVGYSAHYKIVVDAFDWGPASTKAIVSLPQSCPESDLCSFVVTETTPYGQTVDRTVSAIYLCDSEGNPVSDFSEYIAIDMEVVPCGAGSIFLYNTIVYRNEFSDKYQLNIKPADGATGSLATLSVDPAYTEMLIPDISAFQTDAYTQNDITLNYGLYSPDMDDSKHPLIIWLHGYGEGGDGVGVALLGNRVTAFAEEEIQNAFSGAYVLIPQCPTYWFNSALNKSTAYSEPDGSSIYSEPLMGLIQKILSENEGIDPDRIYIGGCSAGGYMTMNMVLTYPDTFAAAFPVCAYYPDELIDDSELSVLKDIPLWFIYCTSDGTVPPQDCSEATKTRLEDAGVTVHTSVYEDVHDITGLYKDEGGEPFVYNTHFSWIYVFNSDCHDGEISLWEYLAAQ